MHKLATQQYFAHYGDTKQSKNKKQEEMGLFTFYKQQQQQQNYIRTHFANQKKNSMKNPKGKSKFKFLKINSSARQEAKDKQSEKQKGNHRQTFLKNIHCKMRKSQEKPSNEQIDVHKKLQNTKDNQEVIQNQNQSTLQRNVLGESTEMIKTETEQAQEKAIVSKSLKKIEQLLLVCNQKISANRQKKQGNNEIANQKISKIKKIQQQEEVIKTINNLGQSRTNSRKVCRISLTTQNQEKSLMNTFQKSFLKKIRQNANYTDKKQTREKQMRSSKTIENLHDQNKKYFCNLINNFYLPHNQNSQAAKMLRDTLKFPNLIIKNYNLKTQGSLSPVSMKLQKNEIRSVSCKRDVQSNFKQRIKDCKDNEGKVSLNERFKFLIKKQETKDRFWRGEKLKEKQAFLKS